MSTETNTAPTTEAKNGANLVEIRDLVKHFPITRGILFQKQVGAVRAVDGLSFDVKRGELPEVAREKVGLKDQV